MADHALRIAVLIAPRLNGDGYLVVCYRASQIITSGAANLDEVHGTILACLRSQFGMADDAAARLAKRSVDRYVTRVVATEEAHVLAEHLQSELDAAERSIISLSEQLLMARTTAGTTEGGFVELGDGQPEPESENG